jgi:hypothetical protein
MSEWFLCQRSHCEHLARWMLVAKNEQAYLCDHCKKLVNAMLGVVLPDAHPKSWQWKSLRELEPRVVAEFDIRSQRWRRF